MVQGSLAVSSVQPETADAARQGYDSGASTRRVWRAAEAHFDLLWRLFRRLGFNEHDSDDAAQDVLLALSRRIDDVQPGRERAFLVATALNVAGTRRRTFARRRESLKAALDDWAHPSLDPESLALQRWRVSLLDEALEQLDWDLRVPFVLFELEELTARDIALLLGIPVGTVASRLRRARKSFHAIARRLRARGEFGGGL
jgi:RNA polymerase sigma-70 factor (ECF subfamily)